MSNFLKALLVALVLGVLVVLAFYFINFKNDSPTGFQIKDDANSASSTPTAPEVLATDLVVPWDLAFLPDGGILVTERPGRVLHVQSGNVFEVPGVEHVGEGGLMGIALHPEFVTNNFVYLYQTTRTENGLSNRIARYTYNNSEFLFDSIIISDIPGARFHDGGRIEFGPPTACASGQADCYLYVAIGDSTREDLAQDTASLAGKILRLTDEGEIPATNPFGNEVYSYGHRNPQGLTWDSEGRLWSTEHGRSGVLSGFDELNLIRKGANYGWPVIQGDEAEEGMTPPAIHSGPDTTWAPASAAYHDGRIFFGGLRGAGLYEAVLEGDRAVELKKHFEGVFGRVRTVRVGPDNMLYVTTSNQDGRGTPAEGDDKVIRIDPRSL